MCILILCGTQLRLRNLEQFKTESTQHSHCPFLRLTQTAYSYDRGMCSHGSSACSSIQFTASHLSRSRYKGRDFAKSSIYSRGRQMNTFSAWIFSLSVLPKKWRKVQPETETSGATHLDVGSNDNERPVDLTAKVVKELAYATAQGSFGDVWKCTFSDKDSNVEVGTGFVVNSDI
ncbi:hypothetical protein EV424DRAFT_456359 [Suillus variegatus]|nr:hypothetical protein EV424DRAFT_456359 [Suillus variegatus]